MNLDKIYKDWNWKKDNLKLNNFSYNSQDVYYKDR
jgi:hypothetical protein